MNAHPFTIPALLTLLACGALGAPFQVACGIALVVGGASWLAWVLADDES